MGIFGRVFAGMEAFGEGGRFMRGRRELWRLAITPIAVSVLASVLALGVMAGAAATIVYWIHPHYMGVSWWWGAVEVVYAVALLLAAAVCAVVIYVALQTILCGVYYARLAQEVEVACGVRREDLGDVHWAWQAADGLLDVAMLLGVWVVCFGIGCIPVAGGVIAAVISLGLNFYIMGAQFFDFGLMTRGLLRGKRRRIARKHAAETMGVGAVVFIFQFVPVLGGIVLAMHVVGATLLMRRLEPRVSGRELAVV